MSYDEVGAGSEEGGYGTTDDEPTVRPDSSSGASSIRTVSSTALSQATTPATSPTRRAARWSAGSGRELFGHPSSRLLHQGVMMQEADDEDEEDDADTDGEGDETDEEVYRGRRRPSGGGSGSLGGMNHGEMADSRMASP